MTRSIVTPPGWDASLSQVTPIIFQVSLGHNTMTQPGLKPGPLDPESSTLTTRTPHLPRFVQEQREKLAILVLYCLVLSSLK